MAFLGSDNPGVPSVEAAKLWRKKQNLPGFDFFNYAGLNRPVRIYTTPKAYIEDVTIVPDIDGTDGIVNYEVLVGGEVTVGDVQVDVLDAQGQIVASAAGADGRIIVPEAKLWKPYPGEPYMYTLRVVYGEDLYEQPFGIRTMDVVCFNRYYGWYNLSGDLDAACYGLNMELDFGRSRASRS